MSNFVLFLILNAIKNFVMTIDKVIIEGYANIDKVELKLGKFNSLVALNNYGKSNVVGGINFGLDFIQQNIAVRKDMMAYKRVIPINKNIDNKFFRFEIQCSSVFLGEESTVIYSFAFDWIKSDKLKGQRIREEILKVKSSSPDSKFKTFINRNLKDSLYLPSPTGRCDKLLKIQKDELIINKLANFDDLFYLDLINQLNNLDFIQADTLQHPNKLFRRINADVVKTEYSLEVPESQNVAFFIYSLKQLRPDLFELFKDSVTSLLSDIEDFEPFEIDLKKIAKLKSRKDKLPLDFPEKLYDIRVKEVNNNQETDIIYLSSGSQKVIYVLAMVLAAEINNIPIVTLEELENSIHPGLLQKFLIILDGLTEKTKIILTSHSPYLIQYLDIDRIKIGIPNAKGLAIFKEVKKSKFKKVINIAEEQGISVGDLIFDKMIECAGGDSEMLNELCE